MHWLLLGVAIPVVGLRLLDAPWWAVAAVVYIEFVVGFWTRQTYKTHQAAWDAADRELAEIRKLLPKPEPMRDYYDD